MFSFVGDTVLDPFLGTGTSSLAAARTGRNSIGIEVDPVYFKMAQDRLATQSQDLFNLVSINSFRDRASRDAEQLLAGN